MEQVKRQFREKKKLFLKKSFRFDPDGFYVVNSEKFIKKLTDEHFLVESCSTSRSETQEQQSAILKASFMKSSSNQSKFHQFYFSIFIFLFQMNISMKIKFKNGSKKNFLNVFNNWKID